MKKEDFNTYYNAHAFDFNENSFNRRKRSYSTSTLSEISIEELLINILKKKNESLRSRINILERSNELLSNRIDILENENKILGESSKLSKYQYYFLFLLTIFMFLILVIHRISTPFTMFISIYDFNKIRWDSGLYFYYVNESIFS